MVMIPQLNPASFADWLGSLQPTEQGKPATRPIVLDVREAWELQTASVKPDGFALLAIPMREIPARVAELQQAHGSDQPIACLCHHGMRSLQVANFLTQSGFTQVVNLQGGIDAWSRQIDPSVATY